jgi:hypothetical protein
MTVEQIAKKTLEINPRHPIIKEMKVKATEDGKDAALADLANLVCTLSHSSFVYDLVLMCWLANNNNSYMMPHYYKVVSICQVHKTLHHDYIVL